MCIRDRDYIRRAQKILEEFLSDFSNEEIESCLKGAYDAKKFSGSQIAPLSKLGEKMCIRDRTVGSGVVTKING